jgi:hypothetical protein
MSGDLTYTEKFVLQVERLRRSDIKTAEFDVHFLSKVANEMGELFNYINNEYEYKERAKQNSSSVDGGSFK